MMLALCPVLAFICGFLYIGNRWSFGSVRLLVTRTSIAFGLYLVLLTELLGFFKAITRWGLLLGWLLPVVAFGWWAWGMIRRKRPIQFPKPEYPEGWVSWTLLVVVSLVLATTGLVAWKSPPQTWDSLTYHMSRVAHWAQNRSIDHFATGIERQVSMSPGAEIVTLNLYVLTGGDRLAPFTQWFAMLGSLVSVSLAAKLLGARPYGQWLAIFFAVTLPIGIVESSSTTTDYVVTFWLVCAVVESLEYYRGGQARALLFLCLASALAVLSKPIAVPYLIPFAAWIAVLILRRQGLAGVLKWAGTAVLVAGVVNAGYLGRNWITFGSISNPVDFITHSNQLRTPQGWLSTLIKNAGLHAGVPYLSSLNDKLNELVLKAHVKLGVEIQDPRTTGDGVFRIRPPSTQEDLTSNPYHAYLILLSVAVGIAFSKRVSALAIFYSAMVAVTFALFSLIFKWHVFSVRYHLPFFVLFAPAVGRIWGIFERVKVGYVVAAFLLIGARPWLFSIDSRPLIPKPGRSVVESILDGTRERLYFANLPDGYEPFQRIAGEILNRGCTEVGIMLFGDDPEYLLWVLLNAPRPDLRVEWIVSGATDRYSPADFQPCAVVCNGCEGQATIRGLVWAQQFTGMRLYLRP